MLASFRLPLTLALLLTLPLACSSGVEYELPNRQPEEDSGDHDGMDDNWEKAHGLDPTVNDAALDPDGDHLSNLHEWNLDTHPMDIDSDDDGLMDGAEDKNRDGKVGPAETDPTKFDTDGDGLSDGQEMGRKTGMAPPKPNIAATDPTKFKADEDPSTRSNPVKADSDGDGIPDGVEDANRNGRVDPGETNPMSLDSDNDGVADGVEDANKNGKVDAGETSASNPDSDGDGVTDGVELGVTEGVADPDGKGPIQGTNPSKFVPDQDPTTKTDPNDADSDGDGVPDGDEDMNHDGKVDPGELNPGSDKTDGTTPDGSSGKALVCTDKNLPQVKIYRLATANLALALPTGRTGDQDNLNVSEVVPLKSGENPASGFIFRDAGGRVGLVVSRAAMTPAQARAKINGVVALSQEQNRALSTWDGFEARLSSANGTLASSANPGDTAMAIAKALLGADKLGDGLPASGAPSSHFEVHYEVIERSANRAAITVALRPTSGVVGYNTDNTPKLMDLVNTSVGRFGDGMGLRCDPMTASGNDVIDILWVVDNSGSMAQEQQAVSDAATAMVAFLGTTNLSWRLALTNTDAGDAPLIANFGTNGTSWGDSVTGLGTGGSATEQGLRRGLSALNHAVRSISGSPAGADTRETPDASKLRAGASVLVVHMSDEEDADVKTADQECDENSAKQGRIDSWLNSAGEVGTSYRSFAREYVGEKSEAKIAGLTSFAIVGVVPRSNWRTHELVRWSGDDLDTYLNHGGVYNPCGGYGGSGDCTDAQYARGYAEVAIGMGGGASSICGNMQQTIVEIMRAGAGIASSFELSQQPVSSSLRVVVSNAAGDFHDGSGAVLPDTKRSRQNGFDYAFEVKDGKLVHKIVFYGTARPASGRKVMVGYRTWLPKSTPAGQIPCDCPEGQVCHPDTNECEVDETCGGECNNCNPNTGLCGDPCDGQCVDGQTCQPNGNCGPDPDCCPTGRGWCDTSVDPWVCRGVE